MKEIEAEIIKEYGENRLIIRAVSGSGDKMASGVFSIKEMRFGGGYVKYLTVGGLETDPRFRRRGLIRRMIAEGEAYGRENGAVFSVLHPFSFDFYRKLGYERVSDTVIVSFPIETLRFAPFFREELVPLTKDLVPAFVDYYDAFSKNRNLMFRQYEESVNSDGTYVLKEGGRITGHIKLENRKHFDGVNRCEPDGLFVSEIGFLSPEALLKLFGFLRMFEGEQKQVIIRDAGPVPEVDSVLKSYMETSYTVRPDIMAKILDPEKALALVPYRPGFGSFTLRLDSPESGICGTYLVKESLTGAPAEIEKLPESFGQVPDLTVSPAAFSKIVFGFDSYTPETFSYLPGASAGPGSKKALDAFPKQINGWFEHF